MKQGWQIKKLGEICESRLGKTLNSTTDKGKLRPYLCAVNVQWDRFDLSYVKEALFENDEIEKYTAKKGDLLVCEGGETGRAAIWDKDEPIQYQNALHRIRFKDNTIIPRFCLHYLHFLKLSGVLDKEYSHGATILHLVTKSLYSIPIPVPSISEQQHIVTLLDAEFAKIDALKANAEKNLQNAKDLFQAALKKELEPKDGWKRIPLKEITTEIGDGLHGTPKYTENGSYFFVNGNNFESGIIEIKANTKRVDNNEFEKYKLNLNETTVLLSINGTVGKTAFYNGEPIILGKSACYINVLPSIITKEYFRYYLLSDGFKDYARKHSRQATIINLGLKEIRQMAIPFPHSLLDQQSIVARLDALNEKCKTLQANYEKTLSLCDDLKQALLRKAFNGEI